MLMADELVFGEKLDEKSLAINEEGINTSP